MPTGQGRAIQPGSVTRNLYPGAPATAGIRIRIPARVIRIPRPRTAIRPIVPIAARVQPPTALRPPSL